MPTVTDDEGNDPVLDALWRRVLETWNEDAGHVAILDHAMRAQRLPDLAGRYRAMTGDPEKAAVAKKRLDGIVVAATQMLTAMKTPKPGKVPLPITLSAFGVCLFLLGWLAFAIWGKH